MKESSEIKRAYIETQVAEFGRFLAETIVLVNQEEIKDAQVLLENVLYEMWEVARKS